jgi:hypothetical protein
LDHLLGSILQALIRCPKELGAEEHEILTTSYGMFKTIYSTSGDV